MEKTSHNNSEFIQSVVVPGASKNNSVTLEVRGGNIDHASDEELGKKLLQIRRPSGLLDSLSIQQKPTLMLSRVSTSRLSISSSEGSGSGPASPVNPLPASPDFGAFSPQLNQGQFVGPDALDGYLRSKLVAVLRTHPLLTKATGNDDFIQSISQVMALRSYKPGTSIIKEGDPARAMFFIIKGAVQVISDDGELIVCELVEGGFFGEIGILFEVNRTATVVTKQKCILAVLKKEDFDATLAKFVDVAEIIRREAQDRYLSLKSKMEKLGKNLKTTLPQSHHLEAAETGTIDESLHRAVEKEYTVADIDGESDFDGKKLAPSITAPLAIKGASPSVRNSMTLSGPTSTPTRNNFDQSQMGNDELLSLFTENLSPPNSTPSQLMALGVATGNLHWRSREQGLERSSSSKSSGKSMRANSHNDSFLDGKSPLSASPTSAGSRAIRMGFATAAEDVIVGDIENDSSLESSSRENPLKLMLERSILGTDELLSRTADGGSPNGVVAGKAIISPVSDDEREDIPLFGKELMEFSNLPASRDSFRSDLGNSASAAEYHQKARSRGNSSSSSDFASIGTPSLASSFLNANSNNRDAGGLALSGGRRASVAVWADEKLMQYVQNQNNRSRNVSVSGGGPAVSGSGASGGNSNTHQRQISASSRLANSFNASQYGGGQMSSLAVEVSAYGSTELSGSFDSIATSKLDSQLKGSTASMRSSVEMLPLGGLVAQPPVHVKIQVNFSTLPVKVFFAIGRHFDLRERVRLSAVCKSLRKAWFDPSLVCGITPAVTNDLIGTLDFSPFNKKITPMGLAGVVRISGDGVQELNLRGCWPIADEAMLGISGMLPNLKTLNLSGCWDLTDAGILAAVSSCNNLRSLDLSNCRKLTDASVIAVLAYCRDLEDLSLSYCKNLTDSIFTGTRAVEICGAEVVQLVEAVLQKNALTSSTFENSARELQGAEAGLMPLWSRLKRVNFQRCSGLSDDGFRLWRASGGFNLNFEQVLIPDCSFLTDVSLEAIFKGCSKLRGLNASFCCALTESVAQYIQESPSRGTVRAIDLSFCGSMVTDEVIKSLLTLPALERLAIRGCIQVTDDLFNLLKEHSLAKGPLKVINISQCSSLRPDAESVCSSYGYTVYHTQPILAAFNVSSS